MSISIVLVTFLFQLSVGMVATVSILPTQLIDKRFFRSITFWATLFTILGLVFKYYSTFSFPAASFIKESQILYYVFVFLMFQLWARIQFWDVSVSKKELLLITMVGLVALTLESLMYRPDVSPIWTQNFLLPLNFISAALLLGGFLAGMIFGHYYLVTTEMPKRLLVTMALILIVVLVFRILAVGATLILYKEIIRPDGNFLLALTSFQGHGIFFWERVLVGLFIPAIVVVLIWSTARIGSNQSATGIMYVAIAFVFIGELVARYLFLLSGIPL